MRQERKVQGEEGISGDCVYWAREVARRLVGRVLPWDGKRDSSGVVVRAGSYEHFASHALLQGNPFGPNSGMPPANDMLPEQPVVMVLMRVAQIEHDRGHEAAMAYANRMMRENLKKKGLTSEDVEEIMVSALDESRAACEKAREAIVQQSKVDWANEAMESLRLLVPEHLRMAPGLAGPNPSVEPSPVTDGALMPMPFVAIALPIRDESICGRN